MYELIYQGRVQARGSKETMERDRRAIVKFTGRDPYHYQIVKVY
jgi:hypothetical protein